MRVTLGGMLGGAEFGRELWGGREMHGERQTRGKMCRPREDGLSLAQVLDVGLGP